MTELEQLRADLATIQEAAEIAKNQGWHERTGNYDQVELEIKVKIMELEAQQVDPWHRAKEALYHWDANDREPDFITNVKEMDEFKQRETLAEQEIWIRYAKLMVDFIVRNRPNGNPIACDIAHYARHLEDQLNVATIRNLRTVEQLRKKLAELTTIYNAIPPACGEAQELVKKRIEGIKKEMQNNGN